MRTWLLHQKHAFTISLLRMAGKPFASFFTLISLAITLSLPAGLAVTLSGLQQLVNTLPVQGSMTVYIRTNTSVDDLNTLQQHIRSLPDLATSQFIGKSQALTTLAQQLGMPALATELTDNPLPDAWEVTPKRLDPALAQQWNARLSALPMVDRVQGDQAWITRLHALISLGNRIALLLAALLAVGLVTLSGNITRLQIMTRLSEIEVSRLIGATDRFIQRPFLYFGAIQGFLAGLLAWGIVCGTLLLIEPDLAQLAHMFASPFSLALPPWSQGLTLVGISTAMGWLGARLALVRTHNGNGTFIH